LGLGSSFNRRHSRLRCGERGVAVGRRLAVEHGHRHVRARECWEAAFDTDRLLVLGGSGVDLFDAEFFTCVLAIDPVLGERAEFEAGLNIQLAASDKNSDLGEEIFRVA